MTSVEDFEELFRRNLGEERGRLEPLVPEELLDVADVGAVAEKMRCDRAAKQVRMDSRDRGRAIF